MGRASWADTRDSGQSVGVSAKLQKDRDGQDPGASLPNRIQRRPNGLKFSKQ